MSCHAMWCHAMRSEESVQSCDEALAVLERGEQSRSYGSTNMNDKSSRSHVIYRLQIGSKLRMASRDACCFYALV